MTITPDTQQRLMATYGLTADEALDFDGQRCPNHCAREHARRWVTYNGEGTPSVCVICAGRGYVARGTA